MRTNKVIIICIAIFFLAFSLSMEALAAQQADIHFYGKVIDQFNDPVAGATVNLGVNYLDAADAEQVKTLIITTNSNGLFESRRVGS